MVTLITRNDKVVDQETPVVSLAAPRKRRGSLMLVGGLVVVLAAIVAAWLVASASVTHRVLVAGVELKPGVAVTESDLRVVEVGGSAEIATLDANDQSQVVGRFPIGLVPAGTAINADMFISADEVIPDGKVLVAAPFQSGELPAGMTAGDRVSIVSTIGIDDGGADGAAAALLGQGVVHRTEELTDGGIWVTLIVDQGLELPVFESIAANRIRLGLVGS